MTFSKSQLGRSGEIYKPTLRPYPAFSAVDDAEALYKAMKGLGTDEDAISKILGTRTYEQRKAIIEAFKTTQNKDLFAELRSELSGKYEKLVMACLQSPSYVLAHSCYKALAGAGTKEKVLTQIIALSTNTEIQELKAAYKQVLIDNGKEGSDDSLEKDVQSDCSGSYREVLLGLLAGKRDEPKPEVLDKGLADISLLVDVVEAKKYAEELYNAGEGRLGTNEDKFKQIFCEQSVWQIAAINEVYKRRTGVGLVEAINSELSGNFKEILSLIVKSCLDRPAAISELLNDSMVGLGTDDSTLIRLVVTRCEIDLQSIKEAYKYVYGKSLYDMVKGDTSGDYGRLLLTLVGN